MNKWCVDCVMARPVIYNGELWYACMRPSDKQRDCVMGIESHYVPRPKTKRGDDTDGHDEA